MNDIQTVELGPEPTEADKQKAMRAVAGRATDAAEARMLLQMLGLISYESAIPGNCGTYSKYKNHGCRCTDCVEAYRDYERNLYRRRTPKTHGVWAYKKGCRCGVCRKDHTRWVREKEARKREQSV